MTSPQHYDQYFLSYSGAKLPLNLVSPIAVAEIANRNTWFGVRIDERGRIHIIHKLVYGNIELSHVYGYDADSHLAWAEIRAFDEEARKLWFNPQGQVTKDEVLED